MSQAKFPIKIGIKLPKVKLKGSSVIRCSFDPDFNRTSVDSYNFTYDFKNGVLLSADDSKGIYLPNELILDFMTSCYSMQSEDYDLFINFQSGHIEDVHKVSDKERDVIEQYITGKNFKELCMAVLSIIR